ncbi:MAG: transaldolase [Micropruina sp.]|uniref:transaldolase n=1 Tax=Micropruina sp. TaxID=2737536 RepID=UPI0039E72737
MNDRLKALADAGVSIWLDDLSRALLSSGNLARKIAEDSVTGVTTNPTIFAAALSNGADYAGQLAGLGEVDVDTAIKQLCASDVRDACDLFAGVYASSGGYDGRVSIEVAPTLAHDADGTVAQASELRELVGRENVLIKIPATRAGLPAIRDAIARGISVNVTLIFSEDRYRAVMDAYLSGLELAAAAGLDLRTIHSVASFFVSRVDTEVDKRLTALGRTDLHGRTAIANALVAYGAFQEVFGTERFAALRAKGANLQRPLWASTGTKDPALPDTLYVTGLVADGVVNTIPEKTMDAFADHGEVGPTILGRAAEGRAVLDEVAAAGVDLADVHQVLEDEGVEKFVVSWHELVASVEKAIASVK